MGEWLNCGTPIPWNIYQKKEQTIDMYNNLDRSQGNYAEFFKKANPKGYTLYDSIYLEFFK